MKETSFVTDLRWLSLTDYILTLFVCHGVPLLHATSVPGPDPRVVYKDSTDSTWDEAPDSGQEKVST